MVSIYVYTEQLVDIEITTYVINTPESMIHFISDLLDKVAFSGERFCLERATVNGNKVDYEEIKRWGF